MEGKWLGTAYKVCFVEDVGSKYHDWSCHLKWWNNWSQLRTKATQFSHRSRESFIIAHLPPMEALRLCSLKDLIRNPLLLVYQSFLGFEMKTACMIIFFYPWKVGQFWLGEMTDYKGDTHLLNLTNKDFDYIWFATWTIPKDFPYVHMVLA